MPITRVYIPYPCTVAVMIMKVRNVIGIDFGDIEVPKHITDVQERLEYKDIQYTNNVGMLKDKIKIEVGRVGIRYLEFTDEEIETYRKQYSNV